MGVAQSFSVAAAAVLLAACAAGPVEPDAGPSPAPQKVSGEAVRSGDPAEKTTAETGGDVATAELKREADPKSSDSNLRADAENPLPDPTDAPDRRVSNHSEASAPDVSAHSDESPVIDKQPPPIGGPPLVEPRPSEDDVFKPPPLKPVEYPDGDLRFWRQVERFGTAQGLRGVDSAQMVVRDTVRLYVQEGRMVKVEQLGPLGRARSVTTYSYADNGSLIGFQRRSSLGLLLATGKYEDELKRLSVTDPAGRSLLHGCTSLERVLDEHGHVTAQTCLDSDDLPTSDLSGVVQVAFESDPLGRVSGETFLNAEGKPTEDVYGVHCRNREYNSDSLVLRESYTDVYGQPTVDRSSGCGGFAYQYDTRGRTLKTSCLSPHGSPQEDGRGIHEERFAYDGRGLEIERRFYNTLGEPVSQQGSDVAFIARSYGEQGYPLQTEYFDALGTPAAGPSRAQLETYVTGPSGEVLSIRYFDFNLTPITDAFGVHKVQRRFDGEGRPVEESYWTPDDDPARQEYGVPAHRKEFIYRRTPEGKLAEGAVVVREILLDIDGTPARVWGDASALDYKYDRHGNLTVLSFIGRDGRCVDTSLGYAVERRIFDDKGRLLQTCLFRADGTPAILRKGIMSDFGCRLWIYGDSTRPKSLRFLSGAWDRTSVPVKVKRSTFKVGLIEFEHGPGDRLIEQRLYSPEGELPIMVLDCQKGLCPDPYVVLRGGDS